MTARRSTGRGRKPKGEFSGKSAAFTTRITPALRAGLEREARRNRRSMSQEVERRLRDSLETPAHSRFGAERNYWLARLVARLAESAEIDTGATWREDRFTFETVRESVLALLDQLAPAGETALPDRLRERFAALPAALAERLDQLRSPAGIAAATVLGLMDQLRMTEPPPLDHPATRHYSTDFYDLPKARKALGLKKEKRS